MSETSEWPFFLFIAGCVLTMVIFFVWRMRSEPARARKRIERAMETEMITGMAHQQMQDRVVERVRREYGL